MAGIRTARRYIFPAGRFTLGMRASRIIQHANAYLLIAAFLFLALLPVFWMFSNAFKTLEQMRITFPFSGFPTPSPSRTSPTAGAHATGSSTCATPSCLRSSYSYPQWLPVFWPRMLSHG